MNHLKILLTLFCVSVFLVSCSEDPELIPIENLEYQEMIDVSYGSDDDQVYDIYLPANRTFDTKVMILVHGGGWEAGDKEDIDGFKDYVLDQELDIAVVNLNYRLANDINPPLPTQTDDITSVVEHLKDNQQDYQIGTDLGFIGASAGAHLSMLWSYEHDTENQVKMVCSIVGPTNLADEAYLNSNNTALTDLFLPFGDTIEKLQAASPLFNVKSSSPPTILFYGGMDPLVPNSQGIDMDAKLEELGIEHEFTLYPEEGHGWGGENLFDTAVKLRAFIDKHLVD